MKRYAIMLLFVLMTTFLTSSIAIAVDNPAFTVEINGIPDADKVFNGQDSIVLDWRIRANREGLTLKNTQGLRLAYDNSILQLATWDGTDIIANSSVTTTLDNTPQVGHVGDYNTVLRVSVATNASDTTGYLSISLGDPFETCFCQPGEAVLLAQVRFAFRPGKTVSDLTANSIRCMNADELDRTSQSTAILINTDENEVTSYDYLRQSGGVAVGGDTLNAPVLTYPRSTVISEDSKGASKEIQNLIETDALDNLEEQNESTFQTAVPEQFPVTEDASDRTESTNLPNTADSSETLSRTGNANFSEPISAFDTIGQITETPNTHWMFIALIGTALLIVLYVVIHIKKLQKASNLDQETVAQDYTRGR